MSYVESTPILKEAAHAAQVEEHEYWGQILGVGYTDMQRRTLIYKHLKKLLSALRKVTGGDTTKAKQLTDLLCCRLHAGERRRKNNVSNIVEHRRNVTEAIANSLREFVHALHDAAGSGRYPAKIRQAQQVSMAASIVAVDSYFL